MTAIGYLYRLCPRQLGWSNSWGPAWKGSPLWESNSGKGKALDGMLRVAMIQALLAQTQPWTPYRGWCKWIKIVIISLSHTSDRRTRVIVLVTSSCWRQFDTNPCQKSSTLQNSSSILIKGYLSFEFAYLKAYRLRERCPFFVPNSGYVCWHGVVGHDRM